MSAEALTQLTSDLKSNPSLAREFGNASGLDGVVQLAQSKGYDVSAEDVKAAAADKGADPSPEGIAGLADDVNTTVVVIAVAVVAT
jgi:predicted ribosomally synthesized peptide with nif11-like leader